MAHAVGERGHSEYVTDRHASDASKRRAVFVSALAIGSMFSLFCASDDGVPHGQKSAVRSGEHTKVPRLWEQQGAITLGMPVGVEIVDAEGKKKEVTMRFCSAEEGEEKGTTYINGKRYRLFSLKLILRLPIKVNAVRMEGGVMYIDGESAGISGKSTWTPESLQQFLQGVLQGEEPTFPMDSEWGAVTGKIVREKEPEGTSEIATAQ